MAVEEAAWRRRLAELGVSCEEVMAVAYARWQKLVPLLPPGADAEDLLSVAYLGALMALVSFEARRGAKWSTWAYRRAGWAMMRQIRREREFAYGLHPAVASDETAVVVESLDAEWDDGEGAPLKRQPVSPADVEREALAELYPEEPEPRWLTVDQRAAVAALALLPDRERQAMTLLYVYGEARISVAETLGIGVKRLTAIEREALRTLRASMPAAKAHSDDTDEPG